MRDRARKRGDATAANRYGKRIGKATEMILRRKSQLEAPCRSVRRLYRGGREVHWGDGAGRQTTRACCEKLIAEGGGQAGQAWCGWFMAAVYKRVLKSGVAWARSGCCIRWLASSVSNPERGRSRPFTFDHIGMFEAWCDFMGNRRIERRSHGKQHRGVGRCV